VWVASCTAPLTPLSTTPTALSAASLTLSIGTGRLHAVSKGKLQQLMMEGGHCCATLSREQRAAGLAGCSESK
jgi:hypothetical protein